MASLRRKIVSLVPTCDVMEVRLAPSGNFLSHGLADVSREVKQLEHHEHDHHAASSGDMTHQQAITVHYHHIVDQAVAPIK